MPAPPFHPRDTTARSELFERILDRVCHDLPTAVGMAVTIHAKNGAMTGLAARGIGSEYVDAQLSGLGGPVADAVEHQVPVLSLDLWGDDRWPALTIDAVGARMPGRDEELRAIRGAAAVPGIWHDDQTVVLSCALNGPADAAAVTTLIGYEQLITAALMASAAEDGAQVADMLAVLQSRAAIEQAKGVIMGRLRCDADSAWATLRQASHESNVKLRVLAVALVEHIGGKPAEQPGAEAPIVPDDPAKSAARLLWAVLRHAPKADSADD